MRAEDRRKYHYILSVIEQNDSKKLQSIILETRSKYGGKPLKELSFREMDECYILVHKYNKPLEDVIAEEFKDFYTPEIIEDEIEEDLNADDLDLL